MATHSNPHIQQALLAIDNMETHALNEVEQQIIKDITEERRVQRYIDGGLIGAQKKAVHAAAVIRHRDYSNAYELLLELEQFLNKRNQGADRAVATQLSLEVAAIKDMLPAVSR